LTGTNVEPYSVGTLGEVIYASHLDLFSPGKLWFADQSTGRIAWRAPTSGQTIKSSGPSIDALVVIPGQYVVYATSEPLIRRINLDGTGDVVIYAPGARVSDLQYNGSRVWWADRLGIHTITPQGGQPTLVKGFDATLCGFDVDTSIGFLFYTCPLESTLYQVDVSSGMTIPLVQGNFWTLGYPRVDFMEHVYWVNTAEDKIERIHYNGSGRETVLSGIEATSVSLYNGFAEEPGLTYCSSSNPFGDIATPSPDIDFRDITRTVDCYLGSYTGDAWDKCDLYPCGYFLGRTQCIGDGYVDFKDIAMSVAIYVANPDPPVCN